MSTQPSEDARGRSASFEPATNRTHFFFEGQLVRIFRSMDPAARRDDLVHAECTEGMYSGYRVGDLAVITNLNPHPDLDLDTGDARRVQVDLAPSGYLHAVGQAFPSDPVRVGYVVAFGEIEPLYPVDGQDAGLLS